jgi:hypothetical protein
VGSETRTTAPPRAQTHSLLCVLDVGERNPSDPFSKDLILDTASTLASDGVIEIVHAPAPRPLVDELRAAGYAAEARPSGDGSLVVRAARGRLPVFDDLTELEPPLPLEHVLRACSELRDGAVYTAWLPRRPVMLFRHLDARGLDWEARDHPDGSAVVWIRRP